MNRALSAAGLVLALSAAAFAQSTATNARVRVVHASPDAPGVDVLVDGGKVLENLPYREYSEYLSLPARAYEFRVNVTGTDITVLQASPTLEGGKDYTVIALGRASGGTNPLSLLLLEDSNVDPGLGLIKLRVVHGAPSAPGVDIYFTTPFETLDGKTPVLSNVPFKAASGYLTVPVQMYQGRVAVAGTRTLAIDTHRLPTWSNMIRTIIAVESKGGGAPFDVIILPDKN